MKNEIKAVFFDHDDTLVKTFEPRSAHHKYIARTFYDRELKDEEIRFHWGKPLTVLIKLFYKTDNIDMAMTYNIATRNKFPKLLFDDTIETLKMIKNKGLILGLVTATTRSSLDNDFNTLNLSSQLFDYIQTEDDTVLHKPDPNVFRPAVKWLGNQNILPSEVLYVGDSLGDMTAALGAGFQFMGIETGITPATDFEKHGAGAIKRLSDLATLLNFSTAKC